MAAEDLSEGGGGRERSSLTSRFTGFAIRVVSAVILVLIIVILLWWGDIPFTVGIALIAFGGLWEFYSTFSKHGYKPAMVLSMAVGSAFPVIAFFLRDSQDLTPMALALALYVPVLFAWCIFRRGSESPTTDISVSLLGVVMVGFCLAHFVLMLGLDEGIPWTVPFTIIVLVWVSDAVAYLAGSALGRHKMAPRISPGKSWEGFIAGTIAVFIAAYVLYLTVDRSWLSLGRGHGAGGHRLHLRPPGRPLRVHSEEGAGHQGHELAHPRARRHHGPLRLHVLHRRRLLLLPALLHLQDLAQPS